MRRGQVAIEFIFIILIVIVYLFGVTMPLLQNTRGIIEDIDNVTKANYATAQIANTGNRISLMGTGSKETITVFVPKNSIIGCDTNNVYFNSTINRTGNNPEIALCEDNICERKYHIREGISINCDFVELELGIKEIIVEKKNNETIKISR